jgi:hypothetical protein
MNTITDRNYLAATAIVEEAGTAANAAIRALDLAKVDDTAAQRALDNPSATDDPGTLITAASDAASKLQNAQTLARVGKLNMDTSTLSPLEVMLLCMSIALRAHDLPAAQAAAIAAAPYCHARLSTSYSPPPLPEDLQPDPHPHPMRRGRHISSNSV